MWNDITDQQQAQARADYLAYYDALTGLPTYDPDGRQAYVDLSIGVACYPRDGMDGETLMRHADIALYAAKRAGRQTYRFYEPDMTAALTRFIQTREALRTALERQEFVLYYQPQIGLRTGRLVGVEALVRWQRPGVGLVMPGDFIDVAEESGLIAPLGRWVLTAACRQAAAWRANGWPDLVVAVNVSAAQFRRAPIGAEIDRSFVAGMAAHDADSAIVQAIIDMAGGLALRTIAEGVEDAWLASQLRFMGCDEAQGYLYAQPLPADALARWLREREASGGGAGGACT